MIYHKEDLIRPFYFPGKRKTAVLLIHGFTACPADMRPLGEQLAEAGYTVCAPLLPGHGSSPEKMRETCWQDWLESVQEAARNLKKEASKVVAVGHSMGGLLALVLAEQGEVDGVVSINAPLIYRAEELLNMDELLGKREYVDKPHKTSEIEITKQGLPHYSYIKVPIAGIVSLNQAVQTVKEGLFRITCPSLIIQGTEDKAVHPDSAREIERALRCRQKEIVLWEGADHYLVLSSQREALGQKILNYLDLKVNGHTIA